MNLLSIIKSHNLITLSCFIFAALLSSATVAQKPLRSEQASHQGVLLLNNGTLMEGLLRRVDDLYFIKTTSGSEFGVAVKEIQFVGTSRRSAYDYQLKNHPPKNTTAALNLAAWCIQHKLYLEAKQELSRAESMTPGSNRTKDLYRRLFYAMQQETQVADAKSPDNKIVNKKSNQTSKVKTATGKTKTTKPSIDTTVRPNTILTKSQTAARTVNQNANKRNTKDLNTNRSSTSHTEPRNQSTQIQATQRKIISSDDPFDPEVFNRKYFPERFR